MRPQPTLTAPATHGRYSVVPHDWRFQMPQAAPGSQSHRRTRPAVIALVAAAMLLAALPALPAAARGPIRVVAREVVTALERERTVELPIAASHVALHWRG